MKNIKIEIPEGYEIDKDKSTFENIVFREIVKPKFQVGDYVRIIDLGDEYPYFPEVANEMGFTQEKKDAKLWSAGYVFAVEAHTFLQDVFVYGIETAEGKFLFNHKGLVLLTQEEKEEYFKSFTKGNEWFTVFFKYGEVKKWICQGDVFSSPPNSCKQFSVQSGDTYTNCRLSAVAKVLSVRKSTQEEIDLVKKNAPEWFKPDYEVGDFVIATCGTKDQLKYIGIYGGKINNSTEEVKQYVGLTGGTYFTTLDGVFNNIVRKANTEEIKTWLDVASKYYGKD